MMKIGEFSRLCRVSVNTLRYYDAEGLLRPDTVDRFSGYRYYSGGSLRRFHRVAALRDAGFSIGEIRQILDSGEAAGAVLENREKELRAERAEIESRLARLGAIREALQKEGKSMLGITIKEGLRFSMAGTRRVFKNRGEAAACARKVKEYLQERGVACRGEVWIDYETEHRENRLDGTAGIVCSGRLPPDCPYPGKTVELRGKTAVVVCGFDEIDDARGELIRYADAEDYQIAGAYYEIVRDGDTLEIVVPVHKLSPFGERPKADDIDLPFENDDRAVGRWETVDLVPCKEQFNRDDIKTTGEHPVKELYFLPGGERYWCFGWTKGFLLARFGYPGAAGADRYVIEEIGGENYLFVELKTTAYFRRGGLPEIWVLRQLDGKKYTREEIRIRDNVDLPFVPDDAVLGKWEACDFVDEIEDFDPDRPNRVFPKNALFWQTAEFLADGNCRVKFGSGAYEGPAFGWTKGFVLNRPETFAEKTVFKRLKGCDTLFIEWKNGDTAYGGRKPGVYVFHRSE